ncbi:GTP pyrophosphokinase family protein [Nocardioides sp. AE5]|uniref:GTP pyrophosphokinase n=1 Tax=Nocardioides sp. AE5 TaxID=2962573 RepID=UPI002880D92A|nr:GTP pyrophosphokinase family protein [Nocardioides sp. AE5]MDT0202983.1 GTP pyrophosphokinase family protein [Nocardioides sp. AE5]
MTTSSPPSSALGEIARIEEFHALSGQLTRFLMEYKFGIDEITTKISILQEEFAHLHDYNPIEHVLSRVKSPESIFDKMQRRGVASDIEAIRAEITDIAGVRVTCSFTSDVYRVFDLLSGQPDIEVIQVEDYIAAPKENGYRSLHALVETPVHLSDRVVPVIVELQLRTVAMDFWASLEHKIYYKYRTDVPAELLRELKEAADTAASLDEQMERLHGAARHSGTMPL